jgi:hypothetical protein
LDEAFERFWVTYDRTGSKQTAREYWIKALKVTGGDPEPIQAGLERWMAYWRSPGAAKMKWPQGWLRKKTWEGNPPGRVNGNTPRDSLNAYLAERLGGEDKIADRLSNTPWKGQPR